jgi:hypothetical protein
MTFLGPVPEKSILEEFNWFDDIENLAHILFGLILLLTYFFLKDDKLDKWMVMLVGVIALVAAAAGFLGMGNPIPNAGITNLEMSDNFLHLGIVLWAFLSARDDSENN